MNILEDPEVVQAINRYREARLQFDYIRLIPVLDRLPQWGRAVGRADSNQLARARELATIMIKKVPPR